MRASIIAISAAVILSLILLGTSNVIALITGSHTIIDITSNANDINCTGCHQRIQDELDSSEIHELMTCEDCHRLEQNITFARHGIVGKEAHACYTPRCLDCHSKNSITLANGTPIKADAFGDDNYGTDYEAHKSFVRESLNYDLSVGENEACIACHTSFPFDIDYTYFWNINYKLSNWGFGSFSFTGTRTYVNTFSQNGGKHSFVSTKDISCITCHKNIYDALVTGTDGDSEDYLTHSPIEIFTSGGSGSNWDTDNPWNHDRYHYIPSANRAAGVNSSYCYKCHNVNKYADENPSDKSKYSLADVANDTNSAQVHAAEALWCQTCHGTGKEKKVINNHEHGGDGHGAGFVDSVKNYYARTFHGDICMGCHEAAVHPGGGGCGEGDCCGRCHSMGNANVSIESEPSGYATNS